MPFGDGKGKLCKVKKCKSTGKPCTNKAVNGYDVCGVHGGRTPRGIESANYKHGGYSPYVPIPLGDLFAEMQGDPQLATVRDELALSRVFIAKHLEHLGTVDNKETLPELLNMLKDMRRYYYSTDSAGMIVTIDGMERLVTSRLEQLKTEDHIMERVEQRRRLVETEQKISLQGERAISVELFALLIGAIFKAIEMGVKDKDERIAVASDIRQLISAGN